MDIEILCHYFPHCLLWTNERLALLNVIQGIDNNILELGDSHIVEVLLYGRKLDKILKVKANGTIASYMLIFKFNLLL